MACEAGFTFGHAIKRIYESTKIKSSLHLVLNSKQTLPKCGFEYVFSICKIH